MRRIACAFLLACGTAPARVESRAMTPVCPAPTPYPDVVVTGPRSFHVKTLADYDACSRCRGAQCCAEESLCLGDSACVDAAGALDRCLRDVYSAMSAREPGDGTAPDTDAREAACNARFRAAGALEQRRMECRAARCARECGPLEYDLPLM